MINLLISRSETTFDSGYPQLTCCCTGCEGGRRLDNHQISRTPTRSRDDLRANRRTATDRYRRRNSWYPWQTTILFDSIAGEAHVHSDCHGLSTLKKFTPVWSEASSLGSSRLGGGSKSSRCHSLKSVTVRALLNLASRLAVYYHSWWVMVRRCSKPWADLASTRPSAARMTQTHTRAAGKWWWGLHGIHWDFIWSRGFQTAGFLMPSTTATIFLRHSSSFSQRRRETTYHSCRQCKAQTAQQCRTFFAENGIRLASHLPHSPDLAALDFFLFGHVKNRLQGITFQSYDELLTGIVAVLSRIPIETLQRVFEHWMERLEWISQNNGDDYR
jgi:hypothetical protein